jgi:glycosidase
MCYAWHKFKGEFMPRFHPTYEFHIARQARDLYQFDLSLFALNGNIIFANFHAARLFAQKINLKRDLLRFPEQAMRSGQINAMGLIDEILHFVVGLYRQEVNPQVMAQALEWVYEHLGREAVDEVLTKFTEEFPPLRVYRREISQADYLSGETAGVSNRQIVLEEMLLLWLANANPAFSPFLELFDDTRLEKDTAYPQMISSLRAFFAEQPPFGPDSQNLVDMLRTPAIAVPHSLTGQLEYIQQHWAHLLGKFLFRLLGSLDLIREEEKAIFLGPGPSLVYDFTGLEGEVERFSQDREWMPSLVLLAKNAFVWLDQLSRQYRRDINRLDQIPDQELDKLSRWGFTGLWLIGLWERSAASKRIKQLRGNPDAVASAYSLFDYQIAGDLGGDESYQVLREKAWQLGIRLASDMVPNHMGIDSRWVVEHPDWFVSLDYSPFPSYSFNGPNLSWDDRVGIYLEDHYYDSTDAAVVFKRVDNWSGSTKYIYHGNDGTSMPWNDTAQLNYLLPEVREAVIQTILHVARKFPVIRFDAAMTLAKKHYQRLWFPEPGTGGAIPTRAEHGLTKDQFDRLFPKEFWREVVDRVAQEVPDTLLLAEAFWLMEGFFVRTLGMHRVYNSAFMNMMRDEKNQEYRLVIKNTLEFDPEILKRYVNFMNNPDERTAIDQFGNGDKYFGVCTLMATMPGLPMFGHGQVEGFSEKYGMEFRRAYWDETPDRNLVDRHEREIFPLLRQRHLFAEVKDFLLYDFYTAEGSVNEDVFAYSNISGEDRSLVIYHNRFADTRGWIRSSAAYSVKTGQGDGRQILRKSLGEGLGLHGEVNYFTIFRDQISGLEYIRSSREIHEQGFYAELGAYKYLIFLQFREVMDNEWHQYRQLNAFLNGRGVPSIEDALKEIVLQPVLHPFRQLANAGSFRWLVDNQLSQPDGEVDPEVLSEVEQKAVNLLREINSLSQAGQEEGRLLEIAAEIRKRINAILEFPVRLKNDNLEQDGQNLRLETLIGWACVHALGMVMGAEEAPARSRSWIDEWLLGRILASTFEDMGMEEGTAWREVELIRILTSHQDWFDIEKPEEVQAFQILRTWLEDSDVQRFIQVNRYQGVLWFNHESFEELLEAMLSIVIVSLLASSGEQDLDPDGGASTNRILAPRQIIREIQDAEQDSNYQVERLLESVQG